MLPLTWIFLVTIGSIFLYNLWMKKKYGNSSILVNGKKRVEMVGGCLPFVGHGLQFNRNTLGFISKCIKKYGKVFRIKIYRSELIIVCDRTLGPEFFKATESTLSLNEVLRALFFDDGFGDPANSVRLTSAIVRKSIAVNFNEFVPKIQFEAEAMINRLKKKFSKSGDTSNLPLKMDLSFEMFQFIANTSSRCFLGIDLPDEMMKDLRKFNDIINFMILTTYFLPRNLIVWATKPFLRPVRQRLLSYFEPEIQKYREDATKKDSLLIRTAVDYVDEETGETLTDQNVSSLLLTLLYVSSENTSLGLSNALADLAASPNYWKSLKHECEEHFKSGDIRAVLNSPLLNACIMESARMTPHIFPLNRKPMTQNVSLGDYHVGDADAVAFCSPMLMRQGFAAEVFQDPLAYNPKRFLKQDGGGDGESFDQYHLPVWGAGIHLCPGKGFALFEIKMALALMLINFEIHVNTKSLSKLNFFTPAAFAQRDIETRIALA